MRTLVTTLAIVLAMTVYADGAITVVNEVEGFLGSNKTQVTTAHNGATQVDYDSTGLDKLVVVIGTESGFNNQGVASVGVKFNNVDMVLAISENTIFDSNPPLPGDFDGGYIGIFYLDDPFQGTANFAVSITTTGGGPNGGHVSILGLTGSADGVGNTNATWHTQTSAGNVDTSLTTSADNSVVIAGVENSGHNSGTGTPNAVGPLILSNNGFWGSQWGAAASGYQAVPSSGTNLTPTFSTNAGGNIHVAAAEFLEAAEPVVPEPASLAMGLAGLGLMVARRHR